MTEELLSDVERRVLAGLRGRSGDVLRLIADLPVISTFSRSLGRQLGAPLDVGPRRER